MASLFGDEFTFNEVATFDDKDKFERTKLKMSDFLNDINQKEGNLLATDPEAHNDFTIFTINRALSQFQDCILYCEEMNRRPKIAKEFYYAYMYGNLRKRKRYSPWIKPHTSEDVELVKEFYNYSNAKAIEALNIISKKPGMMDHIRKKLYKGGT